MTENRTLDELNMALELLRVEVRDALTEFQERWPVTITDVELAHIDITNLHDDQPSSIVDVHITAAVTCRGEGGHPQADEEL